MAPHSMRDLSPLLQTRRVPSGENATDQIQLEYPLKFRINCPDSVFHSLMLSSVSVVSVWTSERSEMVIPLVESRRVPSGENATDVTGWECPVKACTSPPVAISHSLNVLSPLPESTRVPLCAVAARIQEVSE